MGNSRSPRLFAAVTAAAMVLISVPQNISVTAADNNGIILSGGWYEEGFAEWDSSVIGSSASVSYKESASSDYVSVDNDLIHGNRVDIPGLKAGTAYDIKITGSSGSAECSVTPMAFDRTGYAHWNYTEGVGAYNDDGSLKDGVTVIYVTNENKDTITYNKKTGLYSIFADGKPQNVVFRLIGDIDVPSGAIPNDGSKNDGSNMLYLEDAVNVTVEGIGTDAHLVRWGIEMKRANSCEVRNLYFYQYPDDACSVTGGSTSDQYSRNVWIHNNDFGIGLNEYAGNGTIDADKAEGDGSTDVKRSEFVTISYNYYEECHKCSLIGPNTSTYQDWITMHHNWFNNTLSRNPRVRVSHVHVLNNYFVKNAEYGIGASYNSKLFSECNYFEGVNLPLDAETIGKDAYSGTIKSYGDVFEGCTMGEGLAYQTVTDRSAKVSIDNMVSGGDAYDNFDTDPALIYSGYNTDTAEEARANCIAYSGRMKNKEYNGSSAPEVPVVTTTTAPITTTTTTEEVTTTTTTSPEDIRGDINDDGSFTVADLVALNGWLLDPTYEIAKWKAGDLNNDEHLNIYDLVLLRAELTNNVYILH